MNEDWFRGLYDRYWRSIVAYFVHLGFSREEAKDLAQDTFVRVFRGMDNYEGRNDYAFLKRTAVNVGLNEIRARQTAKRHAAVVPLEEPPQVSAGAAPPQTPEAEALSREEEERGRGRRKWLRQAISELPAAQRECQMLRLGGLKYREIAEAMRIPIDTVKSRLHEARKALIEKARRDGEELEWPPQLEDDHD